MRRGSVNHCVGYVGVPGTGKTTRATIDALELQRQWRAYVIAHDPGHNLPVVLPNGQRLQITYHTSVASCASALASNPGGIHAIEIDSAEEVVAFARQVAATSLKAHPKDAEGWEQGPPVVLILDEMLEVKDAGAYRLGPSTAKLITQRRHYHVAILWTCQSPLLVHYQLVALCSAMHLFAVEGERSLESLEKSGIPLDIVEKLESLPDHVFITYDRRKRRMERANGEGVKATDDGGDADSRRGQGSESDSSGGDAGGPDSKHEGTSAMVGEGKETQ